MLTPLTAFYFSMAVGAGACIGWLGTKSFLDLMQAIAVWAVATYRTK